MRKSHICGIEMTQTF